MESKSFGPPLDRGYSLIELLLVLFIVGILAMAGVMYSGDKRPTAVKGLMNNVRMALFDARELALASGKTVQIKSDGTSITYGCLQPGTTTLEANTQVVFKVQGVETRYAIIEDGTSNHGLETAINASSSLKALFSDASTALTVPLFKNGQVINILPGGVCDKECFVPIAGAGGGFVRPDAPVGIVAFSSQGKIYSFYTPNSSRTTLWNRF